MEIKYTFVNVYFHHGNNVERTIEEILDAPSHLSKIVDVNNKQYGDIFDIPEDRIKATVVKMIDESLFNLLDNYDSIYVCVSCDGERRWI